MNRVRFKFGVTATVVAICALVLSMAGAGTAAARPIGSNGVINACFKAKGKNKGALRVVSNRGGCKRLRGGWRPMSWSVNGSSGGSGQSGAPGASGGAGQAGPKGDTGPEGTQGAAGQVEKSLLETIQSQSTQINSLSKEVTDLTGEVLNLESGLSGLGVDVLDLEGDLTGLSGDVTDLEGTVDDACDQLSAVTDQSDELLGAFGDLSLNNALQILGGVLEVPTLPAALGTFECS